ncbi:MAG: transcriptional regulator NrdR [Oscillospiraceae bacterium]|nr:transcriptional regulator NrdR [Oscillospiraceae bacterium]
MNCPFCGFNESKVIDSRAPADGSGIKRRRECLKCARRFSTCENIETLPLIVVKSDKSREPFNGEKLLRGLMRACENRPIEDGALEKLVFEIQSEIQNKFIREIPSFELGEMAMKKLKDIDLVAYVRFASVYQKFSTLEQFMEILDLLHGDEKIKLPGLR